MKRRCAADGCEKAARTRGLCSTHYSRLRRGWNGGVKPYAGYYQRFTEKVALPDENGCMLWLGHVDKSGYGRFNFRGAMRAASNVALILAGEPQTAERSHAAHSCRNKHCVAPAHLRWASPAENAADRKRDGTETVGERHGLAKVTADEVKRIRSLRTIGWTQRQIAAQFGISPSTVCQIQTGKRWGHLLDGAS